MSEWTQGGSGVKFEEVGDHVAGVISFATIEDGLDLNKKPVRNRILDIEGNDGEVRRLYIKRGQMSIEFGKALREAGRDEPVVGDKVAVELVEFRPPTQKGFNPQKIYRVDYKKVESGHSGSSLI